MNEFGRLLHNYRAKSIDLEKKKRLSQERLGELIGKELGGAGYSAAGISDWERGASQISKDQRKVLVALIKVLHDCGGITDRAEAEALLYGGNYRHLDEDEIAEITPTWRKQKTGISIGYERTDSICVVGENHPKLFGEIMQVGNGLLREHALLLFMYGKVRTTPQVIHPLSSEFDVLNSVGFFYQVPAVVASKVVVESFRNRLFG